MRTVVRNLSRQTRRRFSQLPHALGPSLRPYSRRSLQRSLSNGFPIIAKLTSGRRRTSPGGRSSQYLIGCTFPRPSQGLRLWYRLSRQTVFSTLVVRRSHWRIPVARQRLDDIARRCRTWLSRRTYRRLRPALQRNRFRRLVNQFPELYLWPHQEMFCATMFSQVGISSQTLKPSVELRTTSTDSSTQSAMLPLTSSMPDLVFRQLPPVSLWDGLTPTPSPWNSDLSLPRRGSLS
nr:MAG TPA: hypothetical protein [Caudoviricetes sp.]